MGEYIRQFPTLFAEFLEVESKYLTPDHFTKLSCLLTMMYSPSTKNIMILITDKSFLLRALPEYQPNPELHSLYFAENHIAVFELICLIKNIKATWKDLTYNEINQLIDFLIKKTEAALLYQAAPCFTVFLKTTIDGFLEFQPKYKKDFDEIIAKRKAYYTNRSRTQIRALINQTK